MNTYEKRSILIVEDEAINLNMLTNILSDEYTLYLEKSGIRALDRAAKQLPDLILLDIMLPDLDGYALITALKNNELTKEIPVIFISSLREAADEERGLTLGAVDYIVKPYNAAIIRARIRTHMKLVSQRKLLERIALLDGLTEIPNRRSFTERFAHEWTRSARSNCPLSLIIADVDFFKEYNDHYGHGMGDAVLKSIATTMVTSLYRPADFAARIGGEEFAVLLPETAAADGKYLGERIRSNIEQLRIFHGFSPTSDYITVSLGGATLIPSGLESQVKLFELADQQLYQAKSMGKNRVQWAFEQMIL